MTCAIQNSFPKRSFGDSPEFHRVLGVIGNICMKIIDLDLIARMEVEGHPNPFQEDGKWPSLVANEG